MTEAFDLLGTIPIRKYNLCFIVAPSSLDEVGVNRLFRVLQLLKTIITIKKTQKDYEYNQKGSRIFVEEPTG
ncbi:hypothetical protein PCC9214_01594 [Planktothrix tepida]|uniref:Uncharacterized protein n=2 Tax=Planktothrix TaxID=54304 RepID=A0A1J1LPG5_9CYAN|nr:MULTISPECIES: hypothetical protein [Planktothrix]CAD5935824.1 hypothetical protein PCC9214_01594 [Planktothrix tepida]CAD5975722.1 hypothetical protein NO713_04152 [Planktothrix pseudagardhii]CUR33441.1 hypothetical protein PL9214510110 [Planktothrix tepida PCC 9214]